MDDDPHELRVLQDLYRKAGYYPVAGKHDPNESEPVRKARYEAQTSRKGPDPKLEETLGEAVKNGRQAARERQDDHPDSK